MTKTIKQSNRVIFATDRYIVLKSYDTYIASIDQQTGELRLTDAWYVSRTTWEHLRKFLCTYIGWLSPILRHVVNIWFSSTLYHGPTVIRTLIATGDITRDTCDTLSAQAGTRILL